MKKAMLTRLLLFAAVGILLAATFLSCNWILQMAQVRFDNQTADVTFTSITLGSISLGTLTPGSRSGYHLISSGTYTLSTVGNAVGRTWPNDITVEQPDSYTVIFFGTAANLGAEFVKD